MEGQEIVVHTNPAPLSLSVRDIVAMGFRRRRVALMCFVGVLLGTLIFAVLSLKYRAETEVLVRRERVDPVVSADQATPLVVNSEITEEEMNSEVELIRSQDVLEKIVTQCGLNKGIGNGLFHQRTPQEKLDLATRALRGGLVIEALPKTDIIRVSYSSPDAKLAARVLDSLDGVYLEAHKDVHQSKGQFEFFNDETDKAKQQLNDAEEKLKAFPGESGVANPTLARDNTLAKLNEFNVSLGQTRQSIAETQQRIDSLQQLAKSTPPRLTTQMRKADNPNEMQNMESTLLGLELKRSDMVSKYQADYPPVKELDKEIADTRAAIAGEKPLDDVTTDQNPAYVWIKDEQVKAQADLRGYEAKATETEAIIRQTMDSARRLDASSIEQQDLARAVKTAEDNYLLYLRKREEARISEALDQNHILNAAVIETPSVPSYPAQSPWMFGLFGVMLAFAATCGMVFVMEYFDPSFRTPAEVEAVLNLPLLAAVPEHSTNGYHLTGDKDESKETAFAGSVKPFGE